MANDIETEVSGREKPLHRCNDLQNTISPHMTNPIVNITSFFDPADQMISPGFLHFIPGNLVGVEVECYSRARGDCRQMTLHFEHSSVDIVFAYRVDGRHTNVYKIAERIVNAAKSQ